MKCLRNVEVILGTLFEIFSQSNNQCVTIVFIILLMNIKTENVDSKHVQFLAIQSQLQVLPKEV